MNRRQMLLSAAAAAFATTAESALAAARKTMTAWKLGPKRPVKVIENDWIPMKDGVKLAARFWIPEGADGTPVPVVFEYLPYRLWDSMRWRDDLTAANLAPYGIAFVRVDIRGTGNSEGFKVDEYDVPELNDGVEVIAWLARQKWSNGNVGMRGISWGGINSLQIAAMRPPALKAIMPMGCLDNRYTSDAHYTGGAYGEQNLGWGTSFKGHMAGPPDPKVVGEDRWEAMWRERLAATPPIVQIWSTHQRYDGYWQRGSVAMDYGAIQCAVYVVDGWGDPYSDFMGNFLARLKAPRKALIGPWGHIFPNIATPIGLEWQYEEVRWWEHWLKGVDTGIMEEPMIRVYMMYKADSEAFPDEVPGRWVAEQTWPSARIQSRSFWLGDGGKLTGKAGPSVKVKHVGDKIVGLAKPQWVYGRPTEQEQSRDDANSLVFDSAPLPADMEIMGYPTAKIRVAADVPVAKLVVRLNEVTPDGKSWLVSYELLNLTHRDGDERPRPLVPGQFYDVELPLYMIAHRFKKGSKVRVAISETMWPLVWPSPEIATLTLDLAASRVALPVRPQPVREAAFDVPTIHAGPTKVPVRNDMPAPDAQGKITYHSVTGPAPNVIEAVGTTMSTTGDTLFEITEGKADSCRMRMARSTSWKRGDWDCTIEFGSDMTSTKDAFHLREWVVAKKGGQEIFRREHPSVLRRDLL